MKTSVKFKKIRLNELLNNVVIERKGYGSYITKLVNLPAIDDGDAPINHFTSTSVYDRIHLDCDSHPYYHCSGGYTLKQAFYRALSDEQIDFLFKYRTSK